MGGVQAGEIASQVTIEAIAELALRQVLAPLIQGRVHPPEQMVEVLRRGVQDAHSRVLEESLKRSHEMGSTVTLALVAGGSAYVANVGDSRTYLWREGELRQLTKDHSFMTQLIDRGELSAEEAYTHPQRNLVTRSIGDRTCSLLQADVFVEGLRCGDRLVLCCDGLWEMVRDPVIADVVDRLAPKDACDELVRLANSNGGDDNISVIVVAVH